MQEARSKNIFKSLWSSLVNMIMAFESASSVLLVRSHIAEIKLQQQLGADGYEKIISEMEQRKKEIGHVMLQFSVIAAVLLIPFIIIF